MIDPCSVFDIEILAYFSYVSFVRDEISEFKETREVRVDRNNPNFRLKDLYERVAKIAEDKYHNHRLQRKGFWRQI